jgi:hypothetical protein
MDGVDDPPYATSPRTTVKPYGSLVQNTRDVDHGKNKFTAGANLKPIAQQSHVELPCALFNAAAATCNDGKTC